MKKMNQKIISIMLVLILLLSIFIPNIALAVDGTPSLKVSVNKTNLQRGDEFTATVSFNTNNSTAAEGMEFSIPYDSSVLEVVGSQKTATEGSSNLETKNAGVIKFNLFNSSSLTVSGNLFNVTFRVKADAPGGKTSLKIIGPENGKYTPLTNMDAANIDATIINATMQVNVPVEGINFNKTSMELYEGKSEKLEVTFTPADTTDKNVTWTSSDTNIATVSNNGTVTAVSRGTATITATTSSGQTTSCEVNVKREIGSIILNKYTLNLEKGNSEKLIVTLPSDSDGDKTITWKSNDTSVATVSEDGTITAIEKGTAIITATTANGKTATCNVTVAVSLQSIAFENDIKEKTLKMGVEGEETFKLNVIYTPEDADIDTANLKYESTDTSVAKVTSDGTVISMGKGDTKITASIDGKETSCMVHVTIPILSIDIKDKTELTYGESETIAVKYNTYNQTETTDDKTIKWEIADKNIVDITTDGTIITKAAGTTTVTAISVVDENIKDTCEVTVKPAPLQSIIIEEQAIVLEKGDTKQLHIKFNPDKTTDDKTITWKSDNQDSVLVDATGVLTALAPGTATITATTNTGLVATTTVKVQITLKDVVLSATDVTINKGVPLTITATLDPVDATLDDSTVKWASSNNEVATVNEKGEVTTHKAGVAFIYATVGGITKECQVTVNVPLTGITMENKLILLKGQEKILTVVKEPEGTNFGGKILFETSDSKYATVDKSGKIEALKETKTDEPITITASAVENDVIVATAICEVQVIEIPLESIAINQADFSLGLGRTQKLEVLYNPEETTDDKTVTWISSNPEVATVDSHGVVTAKTVGEAVIKATVNGKEATVLVTTHEIPITAIKVYTNLSNNKIAVGKAITLTVKVEPEDATRQGNYKFTSSDENILTVDEKGNVIARAIGKTLITVETENGIKEQVEIEVVSNSAAAAAEYKRLSPKTGDIQIEIFTMIMIISALGMTIILIRNKKNK